MAENELQRSTNIIMKWANETESLYTGNKNTTGSEKETQISITTYSEDMDGRMHIGKGQTPQNIGPDFR
jgi:hypothetical protein